MNFKTLLSICLICICAVVFCACGGTSPLKNNPAKNDMVYSNGGIAVQKGDYIYYMNGFVSQAEVTKSSHNKYGNVKNGGIYRTKLNNGSLIFDEDNKISNSECVVPKLAGYEQGNLYIFGNQLFYTSPNVQKNKYGDLQNDLMDFYMVNVNGTSNDRLYTSKSDYSSVKYGMKKFGNRVYLLILDGSNLYKITINGDSASSATKIASDVTGALWSTQQNYDATATYNNEFDKYVYYTTSAEEGAGNILAKVDITNGDKTTLADDKETTYTLKAISHNKIYYTTTIGTVSNVLYSNTLTSDDIQDSQSQALVYNSYANYYVINGGEGEYVGGLLVSDSTNGTKFISNADNSVTDVSSEAHNVLFNKGSKIFTRTTTAMIYKIDLSLSSIQPEEVLSTEAQAKIDASKYVDYTNRYILYYGEYKNSKDETKYYMHIVDTLSATESDLANDYLLAELEKEDIIEENEEEE